MTDQKLPKIEYLHKRLRCEPETGKLFWRDCEDMPNSWLARYASKEAFTAVSNYGYRVGTIDGKLFQAHRIIFAMHHGEWPEDQIDHINGVRRDNRIVNLRAVSHAENGRNQSMRKNNKSGVTGVYWHKRDWKWVAQIKVNCRNKYLGLFDTIDEAAAARAEALTRYGFTDRHGA